MKILAIDDGIPPKTATATLTVIVQDINDNPPTFLKDYRPVLTEYALPKRVVEILATDDDDRSKSNGPPFTFKMDPEADDIIRASFKVESDNSKSQNQLFLIPKKKHSSKPKSSLIKTHYLQRVQMETEWQLSHPFDLSTESSKRNI